MSDGAPGGRNERPFPSRRDIHGSRIPQKPQGAPEPTEKMRETSVRTPAPATKEATPQLPFPSRRDLRLAEEKRAAGSQAPAVRVPTPKSTDARIAETPKNSDLSSQQPVPSRKSSTIGEFPGFSPVSTGAIPVVSSENNDTSGEAFPLFPSRSAEPRRSKDRKGRKQGNPWIFALLFLVIIAIIGGALWMVGNQLGWFSAGQSQSEEGADYPGPGSGEATITIESGDYGTLIGQKLYEADVVKSIEAFTRAFDANPAAASIRPGTYTLKLQMSAAQAVEALLDDANRTDNAVMVIPGETYNQVRDSMLAMDKFSAEDVKRAFDDPAALGLPDVANNNLEGWLFPGAYEITPESTPQSILTEMVSATVDFLEEQEVPESDWMRVLTEASIVEREVVYTDEMPKVARVIENRIADTTEVHGVLGMDSTVLYGVGKVGGIPTQADIEDDNPYNTRLNKGLPPGPIANPSQDAILAVLNPAEGDWLYFVTVNLDTGETLFTNNFEEHTANTKKFQQWCSDNPGRCN